MLTLGQIKLYIYRPCVFCTILIFLQKYDFENLKIKNIEFFRIIVHRAHTQLYLTQGWWIYNL